ncbi:FxSxx-COOH system tetratricopeptide repeat protein [Streptomyces sp. RG80]|uniref:FxSxx-COOH system tetratricopeptide repeat protein n=1 Tax=Streptomyces sp. RG80 TaxID=3157340 RepID=UPI00338FE452
MTGGAKQRYFISYAGVDRPWAEWVGWYLKAAGHEVELDVWDWRTGDDFVDRMDRALNQADAVVALFSEAYFDPKRWTRGEKNAALAGDRRIIPLAIESLAEVAVPPLLSTLVSQKIHGLDEEAAREALREAVEGARLPDEPPVFPGRAVTLEAVAVPGGAAVLEGVAVPESAATPGDAVAGLGEDGVRPRLPGAATSSDPVLRLGRRNLDFSGREAELTQLREDLTNGDRTVVRALHGMGGIGKTQLALEYAHRFAGQYDVVWWIDAEQADQVPVHYTELARQLGLGRPEAGAEANARTLLGHLRTRQRWLIVLDNAEDPEQLQPWLPDGPGHVLITSRNPDWRGVARQTGLDVFDRADSVAHLRAQIPTLGVEDAGLLAADLGDLPLALAQAAGVIGSGMTVERYRGLLATDTERLLEAGGAPGDRASLAAAVGIAAARVAGEFPVAAALLRLGAFFGPDPIPIKWLEGGRGRLTDAAGELDDVMWPRSALQPLNRFGLARVDHESFQIHRLTQAVLRERITAEGARKVRTEAALVLADAVPGDPEAPESWASWATLASHLVSAHIDRTEPDEVRSALLNAAHFLILSAQVHKAWSLASDLRTSWTAALGADHPDTLGCMEYIGRAMSETGDVHEALSLIRDTLTRRQRVLGEDHPDTLRSANDLSVTLDSCGRTSEGRAVMEDICRRRRRLLGEHHPLTLQATSRLAHSMLDSDPETAQRMHEEVLQHQRRALGEDHRDTLSTAHGLASALAFLGRYAQARPMLEDIWRRKQRTLGDHHRDTLMTAQQLTYVLSKMGEHDEALRISEGVLRMQRQTMRDDHPEVIHAVNNLATTLSYLRRFPEAVELLISARNNARRVLGDDSELTERITKNLARVYIALGKPFEAHRLTSDRRKQRKRATGRKKKRR